MPTIEITTTDYGPEESDDNPGAYLQRCGEELVSTHSGYTCTLMTTRTPEDVVVRQLQVTIPDNNSPGGKRQVTIVAPETVVVLSNGDVMTESAFTAKYGS